MAQWDDILVQYFRDTPGVEPRMNRHCITTDLRDGGLGLYQVWPSFITRRVTLGQNETQQTGRTDWRPHNNLPHNINTWTQYVPLGAQRASASRALGYTDR